MRPILVPEANDTEMRRYLHDPESVRLAREIGVGSSMILPLRANERLLGSMTLVCSPGGRRYDERDLALGEELARRAAVALDNARLYREAREAIRVRDDFLSIASHELNTPIAALQLSVEGLDQAQSVPPAVAERLVRLITRQSRRLGTLVRELLSVAELQAGRLRMERTPVDLSRVVREIAEELGPELARARCGLTVEAPAPVEGQWDRTRLDQVVNNLLSNAMKYGAGHPIRITVDTSPGIARLVVEDQGIGIDPERLRHVFGRFERAVPASNYGGLGLGLYVVREIVGALGGTVSVKSVIGAGSSFTVELPRAPTP
jgi:signal transduction histidine kinase